MIGITHDPPRMMPVQKNPKTLDGITAMGRWLPPGESNRKGIPGKMKPQGYEDKDLRIGVLRVVDYV